MEKGWAPVNYSYFNLDDAVGLAAHEYAHGCQIGDKYETGHFASGNIYTQSAQTGAYSIMRAGRMYGMYDNRPHSPADKIQYPPSSGLATLGWLTPTEINTVGKNTIEVYPFHRESLADKYLYKIPFVNPTGAGSNEYFLVLNFQQKTYWEQKMFEPFSNASDCEGILIWHIKEGDEFRDYPCRYSGGSAPDNMYEKKRFEDLECAIGLYDTAGAFEGKTPCPELGYDNLDQWANDWHSAGPYGKAMFWTEGLFLTASGLIESLQ